MLLTWYLCSCLIKKNYSSQKTCCTHPLRRRRGGTRRSVLFRVLTLILWMWNVQVWCSWHGVCTLSIHPPWLKGRCQCYFFCPFFRLLQDHNSVQPCSDSCAVCWLFNGPVSAHWRQSTSHRGSVFPYKIFFIKQLNAHIFPHKGLFKYVLNVGFFSNWKILQTGDVLVILLHIAFKW